MTAKQWLTAHPDAAQWAQQVYAAHPGRQKHGVWDTIWAGLKARGYDGGMNAIRLCLTKPTHLTPLTPPPIAPEIAPPTPSLHVKKLHVHVPPAIVPASTNGMITAVLYGDSHFPFQDEAALDIVGQVVRVSRPDFIVHMGDPIDAYQLSRFDKNPRRLHTLQDEIDECRAHLVSMRILAPKARYILLEGNHPDRLRRMLWNMPEQVKALNSLRAFTAVMTWPALLGLDELGVEFVPYGEESKHTFLPKFLVKHGSVVRKLSAYTARAELDKYNKSGASGHTHRLGQFFHRDSNGNHIWIETGCTCKLDPEYAQDPDWQQGCVVMTFEPATGAFQAETVYIHNGSAVFRGQFYKARASNG